MTQLTPSQQSTVREKDQYTELYIAKFEPPTIFSCQINDGSITKGAREIVYNNGSGTSANVVSGMTAYIGTTRGAGDLGRVRVRSISTGTSTLQIAPDSDIAYTDDLFVTIKDFHEFWPKFPRTVVDSGTLTYTLYKDYDISLSDQNTDFEPVVIMGPNFAGFYDTFPSVYFTATGSYTVDGSTISTFTWHFPTGCSPTTVNSGTAGLVSFPGPGMYTVTCDVTASNGKSSTGYRHIMLLDRYAGNYLPVNDSTIESLDGEWGSGYILKIKVRNRANEFKDGDLVILFAEDYYDFTKQSFGGYPGRENIVFAGYVSQVQTDFDAFDSESRIIIKGIAAYMVNKEMFSIEMFDTPSTPTDWTMIQNMTINKMLHHFFRWHTTLLSMTDFIHITTGEGAYRDNWVQIQKGEISNIITDFLNNRVLGAFSSDRQGTARAEVDFQIILTGSRPNVVMNLIDSDWVGKPSVIERIEQPLADVLLGGQAYDPPTYTGTAFLSRAPGELQTYNGKSQNVSGLSLTSQQNANELAGLYYAKTNNRFPEIIFDFANNMRNIDVTPQEFYGYSLLSGQTHRDLNINFRLIPRKISYKFSNFVLKGTLNFEPETSGPPGDTIIIPVEVPETNCDENPDDCEPPCGGDCDDPPCINCEGDGNTVFVWTDDHVGRTRNFLASSPNWTQIDSGLAGTIRDGILDPFDPGNHAWTLTTDGVYECTNLLAPSPTWTLLKSTAQMVSAMGSRWKSNTRFNNLSATIAQRNEVWVSVCAPGVNNQGYDSDNNGTGESNGVGAIITTDNFATILGQFVDSQVGGGADNFTYIQASNRLADKAFLVCCEGDPQAIRIMTGYNTGWVFDGFPGGAFETNTLGGEFAYAGSSPTLGEKVRYAGKSSPFGRFYRSIDYGSNYAVVYTFPNGGNGNWNDTFNRHCNVATWNENDVLVFWPEASNGGAGTQGAWLVRSTDGFASQDYVTYKSGTDWRDAKDLGRWPYNPERCFIVWGAATGPGYSSDGGVTWSNKLGDWNSAIASFGNPIRIVPLWIEA